MARLRFLKSRSSPQQRLLPPVNHECCLSQWVGKSWSTLHTMATESTMSLHIRQTPPPRLSVGAAMMWIWLISLVMVLAILFADHTPPPV